MHDTISSSETVWLLMSLSTVIFAITALVSVVRDKKSIPLDDVEYERKMAIVRWCFSRHSFTMAIGGIFVIVSISAMFGPQQVDWSPTILALTSIPLLLNLKIINDLKRKNRLLRWYHGR